MRNKYAGPCYRCGEIVPAGKGYFERHKGSWRVQHRECCWKARDERAVIQPDELRPFYETNDLWDHGAKP